MKHPSLLHIEDFNYELPEEKIARYPLEQRDQSKLLIWDTEDEMAVSGEPFNPIRENIYANIADELPAGSLLVFNNTKVVEARLHFQKPTGGLIELFCLEPADHYGDITSAMLQKGKVQWKCLVGGAKKWKEGSVQLSVSAPSGDGAAGFSVSSSGAGLRVEAIKIETLPDCFLIEFSWEPAGLSFAEVLHLAGDIPLPPYLNRATEETDKERYQTIYAKHDGSVAAPTAGLHFTEQVFSKLSEKNIPKTYITLHVGAGTFKPVKAAQMKDHEMHAEFIDVSFEAIEQLLAHVEKGIIAVGTTSLRTLESLYWIGLKTIKNPAIANADLQVTQWEPYENIPKEYTAKASLESLLQWMQRNKAERIITKTQIIIAPGYEFKIIRALVTNFHQPQSTLLLLISAIVGDNWKKIYQFALANEYRFLSYGDGSILFVH
ncbi:S-adenosylmethionine:tRNA ribosyltransferase-isomerase [Sediminibacterium sp.]|uniref:S-adenosylmethionine:tRNA ribosyltransferase-isomerase n=1 Tax=Sediminibacterium sp. TaxID=1917865 RepID=UPI003F72009B